MKKVYISGNYFIMEDGNILYRRSKSLVEVRKDTVDGTRYSFADDKLIFATASLAELRDVDGNAFADQATFETFIDQNTGFNHASGSGAKNTIVFTQGGQWAYNGSTWRISDNLNNIQASNSSAIAVNNVSYPFNPSADFLGYTNNSTVGFIIPKDGFIRKLSGSIFQSIATQDVAIAAILMRYNSSGKVYEFVNCIFANGVIPQGKVGNVSKSETIQVMANDIIYFATACQIAQGVTIRNNIAFSLEIELTT